MDRFQVGRGWKRGALLENPARVQEVLRQAIRRDVGAQELVEWRFEGDTWTTAPHALGAARAMLEAAESVRRAVVLEVRHSVELHKYVRDPLAPGAIPPEALATVGTRRVLRFHAEIHLAVPIARPLGLYVPRPIKDDMPPGWAPGRQCAGCYWSEHAHAAADDCGVDNERGDGFASAPARIAPVLADVTHYTLANYARLGVVDHIYARRRWLRRPNGQPLEQGYGGSDDHTTHTHTAFADHGGRKPRWL